jgi:hypothetical protein
LLLLIFFLLFVSLKNLVGQRLFAVWVRLLGYCTQKFEPKRRHTCNHHIRVL